MKWLQRLVWLVLAVAVAMAAWSKGHPTQGAIWSLEPDDGRTYTLDEAWERVDNDTG